LKKFDRNLCRHSLVVPSLEADILLVKFIYSCRELVMKREYSPDFKKKNMLLLKKKKKCEKGIFL
jgi:hypothetical protein